MITSETNGNGPRQHPFRVPWEEYGTDEPLDDCEAFETYIDEDDDRPRGKRRLPNTAELHWQWPVEREGEAGVDRLIEE